MSASGNARRSDASRMRIRAFPSHMDERFVNQIWKQLEKAIIEIQKKNNSGLSFEELYRNAYTLVLHKHGERLYAGTEAVVRDHMLRVRDSIIDNLNNKFLSYLNSCWKDHQTAMVMIRDILMYMDRVHVVQHNLDNVYKMGMRVFCQHVLRHPTIRDHFQATLLEMIRKERNGEVISKSQIRDACKMLVDLGASDLSVYIEDFEEIFIEQSIESYRKEGERLLTENISAPLYIKRVEERLEEEIKRVNQYLDPSTKHKIIGVIERELIERHMQVVVDMPNTGLFSMLVNASYDSIAAMYSVLNHVDQGPKIMSQCISHYLREQGRSITEPNDNISPSDYIQKLLTLRDQTTALLNEALSNQIIFRNQVNSDFEYFINLNPRSPEYLSLFIDEKLKRGTKGMADQDVDLVFDKCIVLFRYLQEKDMFERYYKQHLAKRLLLGKSQSDDQEKSMISKLMIECGGVFTNKLEGMFRDMAISKMLMEDFVRTPNANVGLELCMRVLTSGLWPTQTVTQNVNLPSDISNAFERYKA
ncbi:unnamed protein product [Protopolystoma xenopodis]|uniref:Cullin family profile domain-containing protein n=1 Tax=Protopolystoma xenopodis TaxID=117903 RepID=A0A448WUF5_9PLAT|nr:unnamed protein product [Protopolystoma xenopodis]